MSNNGGMTNPMERSQGTYTWIMPIIRKVCKDAE
jgi:hypothetical protein